LKAVFNDPEVLFNSLLASGEVLLSFRFLREGDNREYGSSIMALFISK